VNTNLNARHLGETFQWIIKLPIQWCNIQLKGRLSLHTGREEISSTHYLSGSIYHFLRLGYNSSVILKMTSVRTNYGFRKSLGLFSGTIIVA